jgi:8-oxo-dGTP pyrophosphatase MutT (NUDIX family)/phosphohistidine phosphatase SixA
MAKELKKPIRAAGGVVWRTTSLNEGKAGVEVAIIHRPRYDDWSIPKGKLGAGESELEGALREVLEETGYRVRPGRTLGEVRYLKNSDGEPREKVVRYWAMEAIGGAFTPGREVDELQWLPLDEAHNVLTRSSDRQVLERFANGPIITRTVLVVRHASAGSRSSWNGDDRLRPLDETGWDQAHELVRLVSKFDVEELVSADYVRCVQTLQPLGESLGVPVREDPLLAEDGFPGNETRAVGLLRRLSKKVRAAAVCTQREVIPPLLERIAARDKVDLPPRFEAKKASVWALSFDGQRLCGLHYIEPPTIST